MKLTEKNRKIITYVLYFLSIILVFQIYDSIDAPIEFNKVKNERYQKVIERLKDIRNAQVAFKSVNGIYSDNFDSLVNFIETLSGTKNRSRLELVVDLLNTAIARLSKAGVLGPYSSDQFIKVEKEVFQKLCPTPIMAPRWADLVQIQSKNLDHGLSVNLDPGSLILDTFFRIQDCAEAVR